MKPIPACAAATSFLALSGCASIPDYKPWIAQGNSVHTVDELKSDPDRFRTGFANKTIRVAGYYTVDSLVEATPADSGGKDSCYGNRQKWPKSLMINLPLGGKKFRDTVHHWVVIEGKLEEPRDLVLGGGDLTVRYKARDQIFYMNKVRIVAIDRNRKCVQRPSVSPADQFDSETRS